MSIEFSNTNQVDHHAKVWNTTFSPHFSFSDRRGREVRKFAPMLVFGDLGCQQICNAVIGDRQLKNAIKWHIWQKWRKTIADCWRWTDARFLSNISLYTSTFCREDTYSWCSFVISKNDLYVRQYVANVCPPKLFTSRYRKEVVTKPLVIMSSLGQIRVVSLPHLRISGSELQGY